MKFKTTLPLIVAGCLLLTVGPACAEVGLNGYVNMDERIGLKDSGDIQWNRATLGLKTKTALSEQVAGYAELRFRTLDHPLVSDGSDLSERDKVSPLEIELREAYLDVYAFPLKNMDLRAGKQRIALGTADKLNQTDNLNPYDFTDLLEFGEKIPTNALNLKTYLGETTLTSVFLPVFTPSIMPAAYDTALTGYLDALVPSGMTITDVKSSVILSESKISNSMYALKLSQNILGYDMSLSYFNGYDSIPNIASMTLTAVSATQAAGSITQNYPKVQVIGYDLAGNFYGVGLWAEFAFFKPDNVISEIVTPLGALTSEVGDYTKYTLGYDYTFTNGLYLNSQFMHGFFDERGENLTDLLITRIEKKFFDDKLKLSFTWAGELELKTAKKLTGNLFGPQIVFYPADDTEIELGVFSIDGDDGSKLKSMETLSQAYLKCKYSF